MHDTHLPDNSDLLSICALLRWFDRDLLRVLTDTREADIEALLLSDMVTPADAPARAYQLSENIRADALARLRAERPSDESTWHQQVLDYFLLRMCESMSNEWRVASESSCIYHLSELFMLIAPHKDWQTLLTYIAAIRSTGVQHLKHQHRLAVYEGYIAIQRHDHERGTAILMPILNQIELDHDIQILALTGLAHAHWYKNEYDQALAHYQRAYTIARDSGLILYQGGALANMSIIYHEIGSYAQALALNVQGLQISIELRDQRLEAHMLYMAGTNSIRLGRWHNAHQYFDEAIKLYEKIELHTGLAYLYWGQGFLHHMLGDEAESEAAYLRAHTITVSQNYSQPDLALDIHFQLGFLYQTQARFDEALDAYERAITLAHQLNNQYSATFIHYRRGNVFALQGRLDEAFAAYAQAIDGIEAMRGATETEEIKIGLLGTAQQVYESMVLLCLKLDRPDAAFHYVERARSRAFLDMLAKKQSLADPTLYDALAQPVATLAEVQSQLRADALLLEYFTIGVLPRGESLINQLPAENTRLREHLTLPPQTIIFAITRDGLEVFQPSLDPNTLRPQPGDPGPGRRLLRERLLTHLYTQLIAPAQALLHGRALLYLIPHGPLHYVPFMALRSATGAHLLDAAGPAIALAPSATVLLRNCLGRPAQTGHAAPLLALGYNDETEAGLRYAEAEAGHVAQLAGGAAWAGPDAKSQRLIAEGRHARWLHIAGHAIFDPHDPLGSYIQLGKDDPLSARAILRELALDTELVTLSACMSGISQVLSGDELMGLQRAFLYAGTPAVVCTLWEAADFVALLVMDQFYTALQAGSPPAGALRDAQVTLRAMTGRDLLAVLDRWRAEDPAFLAALGDLPDVPPESLDTAIYADPFYWAPFMLIGRPD